MRSEDVFKALMELDPENDEHWTIDGVPRMDALADIGVPGMTREQLKDIAPLFSRTNRELPDLEAKRRERDEKLARAEEAERAAREAREAAKEANAELAKLDKPISDAHSLTRQNQQWLASQAVVTVQRMEVQKHLDAAVKAAGGPKQIGKHPVEISEAARIKARRRDYRLPQKPSAR
jgi:hypothetical protein